MESFNIQYITYRLLKYDWSKKKTKREKGDGIL